MNDTPEKQDAPREIRVESTLEVGQAVAYLQDIVNSLKAGHIKVEHGGNKLEMSPPGSVNVQLKAKRKETKDSISLKISWHSTSGHGSEPGVKISS